MTPNKGKSSVGSENISIIVCFQGKALVALDGHRRHLDIFVLDVGEDLTRLYCLPAHCSHELQSLDKSFFSSLKSYWNEATKVTSYRISVELHFLKLFTQVRIHTAILSYAISDLRSIGIYP
jgi:hypothetical protein